MKKLLVIGMLVVSVFLPTTVLAQVAGLNVIVIHGFADTDYADKPSYEEIRMRGQAYWDDSNQFWSQHYEAHMSWGSQYRIENAEGGLGQIMIDIYRQAEEISASGLCDAGCVLVTHSTGDLIARYFLDTQNDIMEKPLNIVATLDFAGAGGGTELADVTVSAVVNQDKNLLAWLLANNGGLMISGNTTPENLGVVYDLQPSVARTLGMNFNNTVPRLRFSSDNGTDLTGALVLGTDDGIVPAHSSCGSVKNEAIDSCSDVLAYDGEIHKANGPYALMQNHYPVIMAKGLNHADIHTNVTVSEEMTYVNSFAWLNDKIDTHVDKASWWKWWASDYLYIKNSSGKSVSQVFYESIND